MTDEERRNLCGYLRTTGAWEECLAADEIERLAKVDRDLRLRCEQAERERNEARGMCIRYADRISAYYRKPLSPPDEERPQSDAEPVAWHNPVLWEVCACLCEFTECEWAQKRAFSIYKRAMEVLPKFKAILDAASPRPDASAGPRFTLDEIEAAMDRVLERHGFHITPPDASAELIEAAAGVLYRWDERKPGLIDPNVPCDLTEAIEVLRARGADRSWK